MKNTQKLGKKIRELRLKNDLSLRGLEEKSGVSYSFISSIENDRYQASRDKIIALANALVGSDINELLLLAGFAPEDNSSNDRNLSDEEVAFQAFINNPEHGIFFKDYLSAPEERREEMRIIFKALMEKEKGRKPGQRQGE
ncbi:helix-turn-helix domain-containing protein [Paenibacillus brevis]|uniref:Helix-turn-helix domain-containing protein n=1 Tax=Paenibacillus brevis TaxID=2841508 RepID=A0ABS6FSJ1_9BACL|nr:helix-turn-helix transcriptional regulator [Paenibacillus brevis]MBU5673195.1 helix-turn-helix domain-containing protein [Paenibacillus brevis]